MPNVPENLFYTEKHEWVAEKHDLFISGITDYAQKSLGDVVFIEFPELGKQVKQGEMIATIESVKAVSEIYAPVSGTIIHINTLLSDSPEIINKDPYNEGWLFKIKPATSTKEEMNSLLDSPKYSEYLKNVF